MASRIEPTSVSGKSVSGIEPTSVPGIEPTSVPGIEPTSVSGIEPASVSGFEPQTVHSPNDLIFGGYPANQFGYHPEIRPGQDHNFAVSAGKGQTGGFRLYPGAEEVSNLLKIRRLPEEEFWFTAEIEWEKQETKLQRRVDSCEAQVITLNNEIYQLVGFAGAFQGLLITAAAQGSEGHLTCTGSHWWVIALSIFGTVVTGIGVWNKVLTIRVLQESIDRETPAREDYTNKLQRLKQDPTDFSFAEDVRSKGKRTTKRSSHESIRKKFWPLSYATSVFICLVVFGVLCALSIQFVLCN